MSGSFDLNRLIPHRAPWLLIDAVVERAGVRVVTQKTVSSDDPLTVDGFPETLLIEALAQSAACLVGEERGEHDGLLVALSGFAFHRRAQPGETLRLTAERTAMLGNLHRFDGQAHVGDELVATGQLTFAVVPKESAPS